jgi:hypothetical protein
MLTADDVRAIPLFSTVSETGLGRLAQTAADLQLGAGEFAVHEGVERALYAVIAGKIEVVKLVDGRRKAPLRPQGNAPHMTRRCIRSFHGNSYQDCGHLRVETAARRPRALNQALEADISGLR